MRLMHSLSHVCNGDQHFAKAFSWIMVNFKSIPVALLTSLNPYQHFAFIDSAYFFSKSLLTACSLRYILNLKKKKWNQVNYLGVRCEVGQFHISWCSTQLFFTLYLLLSICLKTAYIPKLLLLLKEYKCFSTVWKRNTPYFVAYLL